MRFPFNDSDVTKGGGPQVLNDPHFDEMLSYCACLHLATWINETHGDHPDGIIGRLEYYKGGFERVRKEANDFISERHRAFLVLEDGRNNDQVTEETMNAANMYFNSCSQDFRCGQRAKRGENPLHPGCLCAQ